MKRLAKHLSLFILAGSLDPLSLRSLDSEMIRERLMSVYFGWIPGSLNPWILRRLAKDLSLFFLAGSLDPWSLGSLDSEKISKRLKSVYFGWIPGSLEPWILGF